MYGFVKDRYTFKLKKKVDVIDYNLVVDALEEESSSFTLPKNELTYDNRGDWFIFDGLLLYITEIEIGESDVTVTAGDLASAFSRDLWFSDISSSSTMAGFIANAITSKFISISDTEFKMNYLTVTSTGTASYVTPELSSDILFNLGDYIRLARSEHNTILNYTIGQNTLAISIDNFSPKTRTVIFGTSMATLDSNPEFTATSVSKITTYQETETDSGTYTFVDYYLHPDGSYSTTDTDRVKGRWEYLSIGTDDSSEDIASKVAEKFESGMGSYKIEFYSANDYNVGDTINYIFNNETGSGKISKKIKSPDDGRWLYKSGNLSTTLTDKLKEALSK